MKLGTNTKMVYGFALIGATIVTISGIFYGFNYETNWAYAGIAVLVVGVTIYNLISGKR